jgi:hypothetical protein
MVSFKDKMEGRKVDFKEVKEAAINKLNNGTGSGDTCKRSTNIIDYKTHLPPVGEGTTPTGDGGGVSADCCTELGDRLDTIIGIIDKSKGGKFSSKVLKTQAATPIEIAYDITEPSPNPMVIGFYDDIDIHNNKTPPANAEILWVICDGPVSSTDPYIYVRSSPDRKNFTQEIPVKIGEKWGFENVYELRVRSALIGTQYRVSEYDNQLTYVSVAVNSPVSVVIDNTTPIDATIVNTTPIPVDVTNTTPINVSVTNPVVTANRPKFITQSVGVGLVDQILPNITIPDGFALVVRSNPFNLGNSRIYVSSNNATIAGNRITLAAGDDTKLFINNANLVHVAASIIGQTIDLITEQ